MIKGIKLKFGKSAGQNLKFDLKSTTVIIGPNNSGKSLLIREIRSLCEGASANGFKILEEIELNPIADISLESSIASMTKPARAGELSAGHIKFGRFNSEKGYIEHNMNPTNLRAWRDQKHQNFFSLFVNLFVSFFNGKGRFNLVNNQGMGDLKDQPRTSLGVLFANNDLRATVRQFLFDCFGKYFVIDPTQSGQLSIRYSDTPPPSTYVERGWDTPSVDFHRKAVPISEMSDGVQAFTGLTISVYAGEEKLLLIDEPEAFLHPSLSLKLGRKLSEVMSSREGNLIVSTHSPNFLIGCIQSGKELSLLRLTYLNGEPTARLLDPSNVNELFKHPLMRSTGVIQSLFYNSVLVTEAESDRSFYNEVNERLLLIKDPRGIDNCHVINGHGHQTIWEIVKPLRTMGIPAAAIVDIDIIKNGGKEFTKLLESCGVPQSLHQSLAILRGDCLRLLNETNRNWKTEGGVDLLDESGKSTVMKFIGDLADYGAFIIPNGEAEAWLKFLGATGHGNEWLIDIFAKMKSDPNEASYCKPNSNDVWDFLGKVKSWTDNPRRNGMIIS